MCYLSYFHHLILFDPKDQHQIQLVFLIKSFNIQQILIIHFLFIKFLLEYFDIQQMD
jgi:hypothetical protein